MSHHSGVIVALGLAVVRQEGSQFCRGFGGIGGLLRYSVDLSQFEAADEEDGPEWNSDDDI